MQNAGEKIPALAGFEVDSLFFDVNQIMRNG
jgi:hypothetical protein